MAVDSVAPAKFERNAPPPFCSRANGNAARSRRSVFRLRRRCRFRVNSWGSIFRGSRCRALSCDLSGSQNRSHGEWKRCSRYLRLAPRGPGDCLQCNLYCCPKPFFKVAKFARQLSGFVHSYINAAVAVEDELGSETQVVCTQDRSCSALSCRIIEPLLVTA